VAPPILDHDLCLAQRVEDLAVDQLVTKPGVEAFHVSILPWAAWRYVGGSGPHHSNPFTALATNSGSAWNCLPRAALRPFDLPLPIGRPEQAILRKRIREIAETHRRYGYCKIWAVLRREGWAVNRKFEALLEALDWRRVYGRRVRRPLAAD
jgi:helix-turn-helix protein